MYLNAVITKFEKIPVIFSFINHINIWFSLAIDMQIVLYAFIQYIFILQNFYSLFYRKLRWINMKKNCIPFETYLVIFKNKTLRPSFLLFPCLRSRLLSKLLAFPLPKHYSQLSFKGNICKTDTSVRRTPRVGSCLSINL